MNDETLTLYYYNDGLTESERRDIESALERDELLCKRYETLCADLGEFTNLEVEHAPADMKARFHDTIERAARLEHGRKSRRQSTLHLPSFAWGGAVVAVLVVGIAIGFYFGSGSGTSPVDPGVVAVYQPAIQSDAFTRGLKAHLSQSRLDLVSMPGGLDDERSDLIMQIVQQNRFFERAAQRNQSDDLARVLRAFEPILLRLASDDVSPEEANRLQAQLAFELNVMLTKLERNASNDSSSI
jgi:hypothetical protein